MENLNQQIRKIGLSSGLLLGVITLVLGIFSFYFITQMTTSFWMVVLVGPLVISLVIPIIILVFFCIDFRKRIGGYWTFRQATTGIFIMLFVAYIIGAIGRDLIFVKLVEPNMVEKTQDAVVNATRSMMEKSGSDQATIDSKIADVQKNFDDQKNATIGKTIETICLTIIFMFVFALIFGAIFKRNPFKPLEEPVDPTV
jgi:hypothetical protein